jgi:hypothetical protein
VHFASEQTENFIGIENNMHMSCRGGKDEKEANEGAEQNVTT